MKTIQKIEAALAQQAERETALIEMAIEMGHEYGRTGTFRPGSPNGLPTPDDVRKRYEERRWRWYYWPPNTSIGYRESDLRPLTAREIGPRRKR